SIVVVVTFVKGRSLLVTGALVGFQRGGKQPNVAVELSILDESDKPVLANPFKGEIGKDVPATALSLPIQFLVPLNRAGKFTLVLKATDQLSRKTAELKFPITVVQSK